MTVGKSVRLAFDTATAPSACIDR